MSKRGNTEYYFDECLLGAAKLLNRRGFDVLHPGHPAIPQLPYGATDPQWMTEVAKRDLIAVTRDRRINRRSSEKVIVRESGLRVIWFTGRKDMTPDDQATLFLKHLDRIRVMTIKLGRGPWGLGLNVNGVRPIRLD